ALTRSSAEWTTSRASASGARGAFASGPPPAVPPASPAPAGSLPAAPRSPLVAAGARAAVPPASASPASSPPPPPQAPSAAASRRTVSAHVTCLTAVAIRMRLGRDGANHRSSGRIAIRARTGHTGVTGSAVGERDATADADRTERPQRAGAGNAPARPGDRAGNDQLALVPGDPHASGGGGSPAVTAVHPGRCAVLTGVWEA